MQKAFKTRLKDEAGNTLLVAVLVMMSLTALAILAAQISGTNLDTAVNDKHHKANYFKTDADMEIFNQVLIDTVTDRQWQTLGGGSGITINNPEFAYNSAGLSCPDKNNSDVELTKAGGSMDPNWKNHTYVTVSVMESINAGNSLLIADGYDGFGKSMAGGGLIRTYTIRGLGIGLGNSQTRLTTQYQHVP